MPRKVKQKQKQKQSQKQTVIVNIKTGKRKASSKAGQKPPPSLSPQFIPYPVPQLRGPEPMVTSQPSLVQLLEALRPIQAPVVAHVAPVGPPSINIPKIVSDEKQEVGPEQMVGAEEAFVTPDDPIVEAHPRVKLLPTRIPRPVTSHKIPGYEQSSSSSSSSSFFNPPPKLNYEEIMDLSESKKPQQAGKPTLREYAMLHGITVPRNLIKKDIQRLIIAHHREKYPDFKD